jgi:hypothetical protein
MLAILIIRAIYDGRIIIKERKHAIIKVVIEMETSQ